MKLLQSPDSRILLILLIVAIASHWLLPESGYKRELKETRKIYQDSVRHFHTLYIGAMKMANQAQIKAKESELKRIKAEKDRDQAKEIADKQRRRYEQATRNYIRYTSTALDSAVSRRYGYTR